MKSTMRDVVGFANPSTPHPAAGSTAVISVALVVLAGAGCTALGPMPATTGVAALPATRPSFELQAGAVPGYYLSSGVQESPKGASISQLALLVEPDSVIKVPGLIVGGRYAGNSGNGGYPEPMLGYRTFVGEERRVAVSAVGYATHGSGSSKGASYEATRGGAEAGLEFRATPESKWFELHLLVDASLTGLSASGAYCIDAQQTYGVDCPDPPTNARSASAGGVYPSAIGGISFDMGRHLDGEFHGGRLALTVGGGTMPRVVGYQQESAHAYAAAGLTLSVGFGESR
jgi:hypothetical protein